MCVCVGMASASRRFGARVSTAYKHFDKLHTCIKVMLFVYIEMILNVELYNMYVLVSYS